MAVVKMGVPLNVPLCLKGQNGNHMQNEFFFRNARCHNKKTEAWEQPQLLQTEDGKYIIQSQRNRHNLQVQPTGKCVFENHNRELFEKFDIEIGQEGNLFFISCHTGNAMHCTEDGSVWCVNTNREAWESWTVIYPSNTDMMTSGRLKTISLTLSLNFAWNQ